MTKVFTCESTGIKTTYHYQGSIVNGIQSVEIEYPKGYLEQFSKKQVREDNLPKTKRLYLNPATGNEVSYARARAIGLLK